MVDAALSLSLDKKWGGPRYESVIHEKYMEHKWKGVLPPNHLRNHKKVYEVMREVLENALKRIDDVRTRAETHDAAVRGSFLRAQQMCRQFRADADDATKRKAAVESELDGIREDLLEAREQRDGARASARRAEAQATEAKADAGAAREQAGESAADAEEKAARVSSLETELASCLQRLAEADSIVEELQSKAAAVRAEAAEQVQADLEKHAADATQAREQARAEVVEAAAARDAAVLEADGVKADLVGVRASLAAAEGRVRELEMNKTTTGAELATARAARDSAVSDLKECKQTLREKAYGNHRPIRSDPIRSYPILRRLTASPFPCLECGRETGGQTAACLAPQWGIPHTLSIRCKPLPIDYDPSHPLSACLHSPICAEAKESQLSEMLSQLLSQQQQQGDRERNATARADGLQVKL